MATKAPVKKKSTGKKTQLKTNKGISKLQLGGIVLAVVVIGIVVKLVSHASQNSNPYYSACPSPHPVIRQGSRNVGCVKYLQWGLSNRTNYSTKGVDGSFGPNTRTAVRSFQSSQNLTVDGVVGKNTWAALDSKMVSASSAPSGSRSFIFFRSRQ